MAGHKMAVSGLNNPMFTETVRTNKNFRRSYHATMSYVHYEISAAQLKKEVVKYLHNIDMAHPFLIRMENMHENRFITVGKYIYLLNHGCDLPDDVMPSVMPALEKVICEEEAHIIADLARIAEIARLGLAPATKAVVSIQDRIREKACEVAGEIEGWVDDFALDRKLAVKTVEDFVNLFKLHGIKAPHIRHIQHASESRTREIENALTGKDADLVEGYSHYSKAELKKCDLFNKNLARACIMLQDVAKVERVPRKKKLVSSDKLVSKIKYKKDDKTLGIVSLSPSQLIGAKEVWLYSTKTRKLSHYRSVDADGMTVKGASLLNFSPESAEKTLRRPAESLVEFKKATKVKLRTFLKDLTTIDTPCNGKIGEHHIILRIDK